MQFWHRLALAREPDCTHPTPSTASTSTRSPHPSQWSSTHVLIYFFSCPFWNSVYVECWGVPCGGCGGFVRILGYFQCLLDLGKVLRFYWGFFCKMGTEVMKAETYRNNRLKDGWYVHQPPNLCTFVCSFFARARKVKENRVFAFCTKNQQKKYGKHKPWFTVHFLFRDYVIFLFTT